MSLDAMSQYEFLYRLASKDADDVLFGTNASLAQEAFRRAEAGQAMPIVWFELPFCGTPRFDLHVAHANAELHKSAPFAMDAMDGYGDLLNWYASEPREGGGLSLAYDVGEGSIDAPAVHVNVNSAAVFDAEGFFAHVGRPDASALFNGFVGRLPRGWRIWYFGVHPGRPGAPVRVDCFVDEDLERKYAVEPAKLEEDLREVEFIGAGAKALCVGAQIASSRLGMELQFDILSDGRLGQTVGISTQVPLARASKVRAFWGPGGDLAQLMEFAEELGIADARWQHVQKTIFTTVLQDGDVSRALYCVPVFVKFRVCAGEPLDSKLYLQAGAKEL